MSSEVVVNIKVSDSSQILEAQYCTASEELKVVFSNRSVYKYYEVPAPIVVQMIMADSIGSYFHKNIKSAGYSYAIISDPMKYNPGINFVLLEDVTPRQCVEAWNENDVQRHANSIKKCTVLKVPKLNLKY